MSRPAPTTDDATPVTRRRRAKEQLQRAEREAHRALMIALGVLPAPTGAAS